MDYEKIGAFIASRRKNINLTQKDLGDKLGITDRAVSRWERGIGCPDISMLEPLSKILKVSVLEILHGEIIESNENEVIVDILKSKNKTIKFWKVLSLVFINVILGFLLFLIFTLFLLPISVRIKGNTIYSVTSHSMEPTLNIYDNVYFETIAIEDVKENDIILFRSLENEFLVAHRVNKIVDTNKGVSLITKGDNNNSNDKEYVTSSNFIGRMYFKIPRLGKYALNKDTGKLVNLMFLMFLILGIISIAFLDYLQFRKMILKKY